MNGGVHTARKQHQRKNIGICTRVASSVLCGLGLTLFSMHTFRMVQGWLKRTTANTISICSKRQCQQNKILRTLSEVEFSGPPTTLHHTHLRSAHTCSCRVGWGLSHLSVLGYSWVWLVAGMCGVTRVTLCLSAAKDDLVQHRQRRVV